MAPIARTSIVLLCLVGSDGKAFKALKSALTGKPQQKDIKVKVEILPVFFDGLLMSRQRKGHCVLTAKHLGGGGALGGAQETSSPWEASVAAKLDKETKKYALDYVTYGERTFVQEAGRQGKKPVTKSIRSSLSWFFEPTITGDYMGGNRESEDLTCEESIIKWGKDIRTHGGISNIRNVKKEEERRESIDRSVLAIAQDIWSATLSREKDHRTVSVSQSIATQEPPLESTIDFVLLEEDRVSYIVFSHDSEKAINIPLKFENVDEMRRQAINLKEEGSIARSPVTVQKAIEWGILDNKYTTLTNDAKGRLLIAIASGWHDTLGPKRATAHSDNSNSISESGEWVIVDKESA
ncbi:hypothetical protein FOL47_001094 [Perkinsus chesapeaki]|uniref:Uncharacterized protein n=1 Tax=Perkinsus chesapeaki TaxID=330153 RepID=A0A7J6ML60_PERCH|nr:hypothetical protein FOL47_001094 [Perkinsus chesapeaki]